MSTVFRSEPLEKAYKIVEAEKAVLIATKGYKEGLYDLTPIAWIMPIDYEPVTKIIFSCDPKHQAARNIKRSGHFAVCLPEKQSDPVIEKCGSISSEDADKFARFGITGQQASLIDVRIPVENTAAWIECRLVRTITEGSVELFIGQAVAVFRKSQSEG